MFNIGINRFGGETPPVIKNLLYINGLMLLATYALLNTFKIDLTDSLALFYPESSHFKVYQLITHMFMHADIKHVALNMFILWMFGRALENVWGSKRFLVYYIATGLGAAFLHEFVNYIEIMPLKHAVEEFVNSPSPEMMAEFTRRFIEYPKYHDQFLTFAAEWSVNSTNPIYTSNAINMVYSMYDSLISIPTVGASGAVYGVLLGFGMLFPNTELRFIFFPIFPIKAKYIVMFMGGAALYNGLTQPGSNIAHFAHLGGMLFGFLIIKYWNRKSSNFY